MKHFRTICFLLLVTSTPGFTQTPASPTDVKDAWSRLNVNALSMYFWNNGMSGHSPSGEHGVEYPPGSGKYLVFGDGFVFGGMQDGVLHIGGATYRPGMRPGGINTQGTATPPTSDTAMYHVKRMLRTEFAALPAAMQAEFRAGFLGWPVHQGAPWQDADGDGVYTPHFDAWLDGDTTVDAPAFVGDEMISYTMNDLDPTLVRRLYGTSPMHIEVRCLAWASAGPGVIGRSIFHRITLINRSTSPITDMYFSRWVDPDLGYPFDDLVGVDSARGLAYIYNGQPYDSVYGCPPAVGYLLLQGPIVPRPGGAATFNFQVRQNAANLGLCGFTYYVNSSPVLADPNLGDPNGGQMMYNNMQGLLWNTKACYDPSTHVLSHFPLSGDPVQQSGWIDGIEFPPGDRRMLMSSGPITLAPLDTQEVIVVLYITECAGGRPAIEALFPAADTLLMRRPQIIASAAVPIAAPHTSLITGVWPSPAAAQLTAGIALAEAGGVDLTLYDLLGRPVRRLAVGIHGPGAHIFTTQTATVATGLYILRMTTTTGAVQRTVLIQH